MDFGLVPKYYDLEINSITNIFIYMHIYHNQT